MIERISSLILCFLLALEKEYTIASIVVAVNIGRITLSFKIAKNPFSIIFCDLNTENPPVISTLNE